MLEIKMPQVEWYDEKTNTFTNLKPTTLRFEHSLIAISKWEQVWHRSLLKSLSNHNLTNKEFIDYIRCMSLDSHTTFEEILMRTSDEFLTKVVNYINDSATATVLYNIEPDKPSTETVTSELIYCWMAMARIPFEPCEKWHINRLLTLIEVYGLKTNPPKKMSPAEVMKWQRQENERRKKELGTRG